MTNTASRPKDIARNVPARYTVQTKIERSVHEVFESIVEPSRLNQYFTDSTSGPLVAGASVVWHWKEWGDYPVQVRAVETNRLIELEIDSTAWKKTSGPGYPVLIRIELEALNSSCTLLKISESGWPVDADGLKASHENCSGWTHMAICLKAYLEHGLDLR